MRPSFWDELRRRRVVRAIAVYGVAAWVVVQVADVFFPALLMPGWTVTLVAALAVLGFPVTVALAWIFDRTPDGLRRTGTPHEPPPTGTGGAAGSAGTEAPAAAPRPTPARRNGIDRRLAAALVLGVVLGVLVVAAGRWATGAVRGLRTNDGPPGGAVVAVLPFETVGDVNPTFADGIHGYILTGLSSVAGLDVISRGSVLRYGSPTRPASEIASELGAGWILRGEVQQVEEQIRVHARLVNARSDRQAWAETYGGRLTAANLFDIQGEITGEIVAALQDRLAGSAPDRRAGRTTDDLEAYRLYAQGRGLLVRRTESAMRRAAAYFGQALERDSTYAAAWAGLADALTYLETFGFQPPPDAVSARRAAERSIELDPFLAEGHFALANLAHAERDNPEAVRRAEQAIGLRSSYSDAYNLLSFILRQHGDTEEALEAAERAVDLDPLGSAPLSNLALAHLAGGDAAAALAASRRIRELRPDFSTGSFLEALALYHQGRFAEAAPLLQGVEVAWADPAPRATLALARLALGDTMAAREFLAGLDPSSNAFSAALIRIALGETDAGIDAMAAIERWDYWPTLAVRYLFPQVLAPLRSDPRYAEILRRVDASWGGQPPLPL